ncbi:MAG TPA: GFA family protein [Vitreimonas sp.]|jgi:hypothetical protein|nr:GFA family protein [Vitreimonas sp.]
MKVDGGCHCGAIRYQAEIDPERVVICHCTDCQAMSGAPYRVNAPAPLSSFEVTGAPTLYEKVGSSGALITTAFCPTCGAGVYSCKAENPQYVNIRLGGMRQRAQLEPKAQGFCDSAMPWAWDIRGVRQVR